MASLESKVLSGLRWRTVTRVLGQLISWASTIVVIRLLAPGDYGLMAMATIVLGLTALVAEMGLSTAVVQARSVNAEFLGRTFGLSLVLKVGLYLLIAVSAPWLGDFFEEPRLPLLLWVVALQLPIAAFTVVPNGMAQREMRYKALSLIDLINGLVTSVAVAGAAWGGMGVWALAIGQVGGGLLRAAMLQWHFGFTRPRFDLRGQRELLSFGSSLTANRVIWYFAGQADLFIGGKLLGTQLLGVYAVAANLATMPMSRLMGIANQVAMSAFSRLQEDLPALRRALLNAIELMVTLSTLFLWGLAATAPDLVPLLLGEKWAGAVLPLQAIAVVVPLRLAGALLSTAAIGAGQLSLDLGNTITAACVLVPAFYIGATLAGVQGLAAAWAMGYPLVFLLNTHRVCRGLGLSMTQVFSQLKVGAAAGGLMVAGVFALTALLNEVHAFARLLATVAAAGVIYIGTVYVMKRSLLAQALKLFRPSAS